MVFFKMRHSKGIFVPREAAKMLEKIKCYKKLKKLKINLKNYKKSKKFKKISAQKPNIAIRHEHFSLSPKTIYPNNSLNIIKICGQVK